MAACIIIIFTILILNFIDVQIIFTEDVYQVNESNMTGPVSFMPVKVSKNSQIANPIVLDVIPLTVMDASTWPPGLPNNVPADDPFSSPFASTYNLHLTHIYIFMTIITPPHPYSYA